MNGPQLPLQPTSSTDQRLASRYSCPHCSTVVPQRMDTQLNFAYRLRPRPLADMLGRCCLCSLFDQRRVRAGQSLAGVQSMR